MLLVCILFLHPNNIFVVACDLLWNEGLKSFHFLESLQKEIFGIIIEFCGSEKKMFFKLCLLSKALTPTGISTYF